MFLETQLDMEKNRVDQERKKLTLAHEQIAQLVGIFSSILKIMSFVQIAVVVFIKKNLL